MVLRMCRGGTAIRVCTYWTAETCRRERQVVEAILASIIIPNNTTITACRMSNSEVMGKSVYILSVVEWHGRDTYLGRARPGR